MVKLNKIYTRTGDKGTTALGTGERRSKSDVRISAYGTIDEANAVIGIARLHIPGELDAMLGRIQNDLFDLGADLCVPDTGEKRDFEPLRVVAEQVERLEREIDRLNADLEPLNSFILPGGTTGAAYLHLARTVVRRAERDMAALLRAGEQVNEDALRYVNRLSDFLFVAARHVNDKGGRDVLWVPAGTREG